MDYFMQLSKQNIDQDTIAQLPPSALEKITHWKHIDECPSNLSIGEMMNFIVNQGEKKALLQLLIVWARLGGELADLLWDFIVDILEDRPQEVSKRRPRRL